MVQTVRLRAAPQIISVSLSFSACAIFSAVLGLHDCYRSVAATSAPASSKQRGTRVSGEEAFDSLGSFLRCLLGISSAQLTSLDSIRDRPIDLRWNPRLTSIVRQSHQATNPEKLMPRIRATPVRRPIDA